MIPKLIIKPNGNELKDEETNSVVEEGVPSQIVSLAHPRTGSK